MIPNPTTTSTETSPAFKYGDQLRFQRLVLERFGLNFPENRLAMLEQGVQRAFAASTCTNLEEYYHLLNDSEAGSLYLGQLANTLTVSESHFFRDAAQCDALYHLVLPEIIERRRLLRTMRIWSAGCASGEEPYTLAIMLRELLPDVDDWSITILGTDINTESLDRARRGIYSEWAFREEWAKQLQKRYFHKQDNRYELTSDVQRMVTYKYLNLVSQEYPAFETNTKFMDLILCRNVTIYFTQEITQHIIERLYQALVDEGWLVVGHSEHSLSTFQRFQEKNFPGAILYQRPTEYPIFTGDTSWLVTQEVAAPPQAITPIASPQTAHPTAALEGNQPLYPKPAESFPQECGSIEQATEFIEYGRLEQARELLTKMVETNPKHTAACLLLGQVHADMGNWEQAEKYCNQTIRLNKLSVEAYYILALVLQHQGRLDQAIEAMKKVVYIDRKNVLGHFCLADLYHSKELLQPAMKSLDNAWRLLYGQDGDEIVPRSGGITVDRLRQAITRQQQQWSVIEGKKVDEYVK